MPASVEQSHGYVTTKYWIPSDAHPSGRGRQAWFRIEGTAGYRAAGHPRGPSDEVCLRVSGTLAYPTLSLPEDGPRFEIVGSAVYLVGSGDEPWFVVTEQFELE